MATSVAGMGCCPGIEGGTLGRAPSGVRPAPGRAALPRMVVLGRVRLWEPLGAVFLFRDVRAPDDTPFLCSQDSFEQREVSSFCTLFQKTKGEPRIQFQVNITRARRN